MKRTAAAAAIEQEWRDLRNRAETARIATHSLAIDDGPVMRHPAGVAYIAKIAPDGTEKMAFDTGDGRQSKALEHLFAAVNDRVTVAPASAVPNAATNWRGWDGRSAVCPVVVCHGASAVVSMIRKMAIINEVPVPAWWPWDAEPGDMRRVHDVQWMWDRGATRLGLDRQCRALKIPARGDLDDAGVWDAIAAGRYSDVIEYCDDEVLRLRCIHRRLLDLQPLKADLAILRRDYGALTQDEWTAAGYPPAEGAAA